MARALMARASSVDVESKYGDSNRPPRNQRAETLLPVTFTKARQMPGALLLSTIAFRIPGPHHAFALETPIVTGPRSAASVDWPASRPVKPRVPKRSGRSMEYAPTCHGVEELLRPGGRGSCPTS